MPIWLASGFNNMIQAVLDIISFPSGKHRFQGDAKSCIHNPILRTIATPKIEANWFGSVRVREIVAMFGRPFNFSIAAWATIGRNNSRYIEPFNVNYTFALACALHRAPVALLRGMS